MTAEHRELVREIEALRERLAAAEAELAGHSGPTRRTLLKGAGALAAAGGALVMASQSASAIPGDGSQERSTPVDVPRSAAEVSLHLRANGAVIGGDFRDGGIEVFSVRQQMALTTDRLGLPTGRRVHQPLELRKAVDKASPLIARALTNNEVIEAEFRFFRPSPSGDGTTEHFFTIQISDGRVRGYEFSNPDGFSVPAAQAGSAPSAPVFEDVAMVYRTIKWTYLAGGVEHEDTWEPR